MFPVEDIHHLVACEAVETEGVVALYQLRRHISCMHFPVEGWDGAHQQLNIHHHLVVLHKNPWLSDGMAVEEPFYLAHHIHKALYQHDWAWAEKLQSKALASACCLRVALRETS
jgi:hypothetical protein